MLCVKKNFMRHARDYCASSIWMNRIDIMYRRFTTVIMCMAAAFAAVAQTEEPDSLSVSELGEVVVEGRQQRTGAEKSTYIPSKATNSIPSFYGEFA